MKGIIAGKSRFVNLYNDKCIHPDVGWDNQYIELMRKNGLNWGFFDRLEIHAKTCRSDSVEVNRKLPL